MVTSTYVIVEPANGEFDISPAPNPFEIGELVPQARPELEGVAPFLYRLEHPERQLGRVQELAQFHAHEGRPPVICAILQTAADTLTIREHLASALLLNRPETDVRPAVFRFYDPRVFAHLRWILDTAQFLALMGPITRWAYLARPGTWVDIPFEGLASPGLQVDAEQFAQLGRLAYVRLALEPLVQRNAALPEDLPQRLDRQVAKAERYGLAPEDRVAFALHGVFVAPNFDQHPQVRSVLAAIDDVPYAEAVSKWTDEVWTRIRAESVLYEHQ
jgi:hypothetical protein